MTAANTVEFTAPCDQCGSDATWHGEFSLQGTSYDRIDCTVCDGKEHQ